MNHLNINIAAILIVILMLSGCKTEQIAIENVTKSVPKDYPLESDTLNSASLKWSEFFKDSTLLGLIEEGLRNNLDVKSALQRIEMARANVRGARGLLLPQVSAAGSVAQRKYGLYTMDGAGNATTPINGEELVPVHLKDYFIGLQMSWEIDIWGKLRGAKASSLSRFLASTEGKNLVGSNLVYEIALNYYELLALDHQLDVVRETIRLQQNARDLTVIQKDAGVVTKLAVEQFEAQLLHSQSLEKEIIQQIVVAESAINLLLGRYPQKVNRDKSSFLDDVPIDVSVGLPGDLIRFRPDIRQSELELVAANADVRAARAAFLPSLNITGLYGFQAYKTSFLFETPESIAYSIMGGLAAPLINRSAIKAQFKSAKASQLEALYRYQQSILNSYVEVYNEMANLRALADIAQFKQKEVEFLSTSIETSKELFQYRRATYLEVIIAQRNALETKLELVELKKRQLQSVANLYKALGGGWN
jgi:outer membrane protein, multidrug efflux system